MIDMGIWSGDDAHSICPEGFGLPVIRSKDELDTIQQYIGEGGKTGCKLWKSIK